MSKYRKKPIVIEARQFTGWNYPELNDWITGETHMYPSWVHQYEEIIIPTLEGDMKASIGDYIIKGVKGEFYPCKPDIFEETYERVGVSNA